MIFLLIATLKIYRSTLFTMKPLFPQCFKGAKHLNDGIAASQVLLDLDLSHNSLGDKGLFNLIPGLSETPSLMKLDLSHNQLTEECAEALESFLLENNTLEELNLAWNCLNTGLICKRVFRTILSKDLLKRLIFSWNALEAITAVSPIARYITRSEVLEYLDISHNRLNGPPLKRIRIAILKNHSLISVKIGNNPFPPDQAYFVASVVTAKANDPLEFLDMENIWFTKEILQMLDPRIELKYSCLNLKHGIVKPILENKRNLN